MWSFIQRCFGWDNGSEPTLASLAQDIGDLRRTAVGTSNKLDEYLSDFSWVEQVDESIRNLEANQISNSKIHDNNFREFKRFVDAHESRLDNHSGNIATLFERSNRVDKFRDHLTECCNKLIASIDRVEEFQQSSVAELTKDLAKFSDKLHQHLLEPSVTKEVLGLVQDCAKRSDVLNDLVGALAVDVEVWLNRKLSKSPKSPASVTTAATLKKSK